MTDVRRGQIYQLGAHRLMCGALVVTSPPSDRLANLINEIRHLNVQMMELTQGQMGPRKFYRVERIKSDLQRLHMELSECLDAQVPARPRR